MKPVDFEQFLGPTLSDYGFKLDEVQDTATYGGRPAWAVYYRTSDCKLQICWSARDGGIDVMLAPLDAPNEFGQVNRSKKWQFMLMLSKVRDDLNTPGLDADDAVRAALLAPRSRHGELRFSAQRISLPHLASANRSNTRPR
jgi:hypothetical protein